MAHKLHETLGATAKVLEVEDVPGEQEFAGVVREMPAFDLSQVNPGELNVHLKRPFLFSLLGENISRSIVTKRLAGMIGGQLTKSLSAYHALLYDWSEREPWVRFNADLTLMPTAIVLRSRGWSAIMCRRPNKKAPFVVIWKA